MATVVLLADGSWALWQAGVRLWTPEAHQQCKPGVRGEPFLPQGSSGPS